MRNLELISENLQKQILGEEPNEIEYFINEAKKYPSIAEINILFVIICKIRFIISPLF